MEIGWKGLASSSESVKKGFQRLAKRGERPNDPDLPVRRICRDLPPGLVGGGSWKSDLEAGRQSDGVVSSREEEFVYLDYFMYGVFVELYGV